MRKIVLTIVAVAAVGVAGAAFYGLAPREEPLARGDLVEALIEEPDEDRLTDVFARFVPAAASLDLQATVLLANGFRCAISPAHVEGNSYLTCDRPIEGTGYCRGFRYYSYQTKAGEIIETLGSAFDGRRDSNMLGRCDGARQHFLALADGIDEIRLTAQR